MIYSDENLIDFQLQQDYGHFTVATVDVVEVPTDCNCINTARIWSVLPKINILSDLKVAQVQGSDQAELD